MNFRLEGVAESPIEFTNIYFIFFFLFLLRKMWNYIIDVNLALSRFRPNFGGKLSVGTYFLIFLTIKSFYYGEQKFDLFRLIKRKKK